MNQYTETPGSANGASVGRQARHQKIVMLLDGSRQAERPIVYAAEIACAHDAELILLHVVAAPLNQYVGELTLAGQTTSIDHLRQQVEVYLKGLQGSLRAQGIKARIQVAEGPEVVPLVGRFVQSEDVNLVVMSAPRRGRLARFLTGDPAAHLQKHVNIPVMTV